MQIGTFTKNESGDFQGRIQTLTFTADVTFVPAEDSPNERAPQFKVVSTQDGIDLGAGWHEISQRTNKPYISVKIDDPSFAYPMWAALTMSEAGIYTLNWSRPKPKGDTAKASQGDTL